MVVQILLPLVLLGNGLAAGIMLSTVIGVVPWMLAQPYDRYVGAIRFMWPRYDPFMPIVNALTCVLDIVLIFVAPTAASRALFGTAAGLLLVVMAISVVKNVPINRYVTSLDPEDRPADWEERDPRVRWRNWNLIRTVLALVAFGVNAWATTALI
ncbi:anthrone oxygenase family protein [Streptosporangium sp. G11]|uniref:anthrone oxygenase family protein n=1 Tax=Streptosporangium sp. G11 TaxID=3436926 RepID=UPI003EC0E377